MRVAKFIKEDWAVLYLMVKYFLCLIFIIVDHRVNFYIYIHIHSFWSTFVAMRMYILDINFRSRDEIKAKAAELNELCRSKSFNIQHLIPTIKVQHCLIFVLVTALLPVICIK